jgi:hypothetical protein
VLDKYIGSQFEPLTLHILLQSIDKHIKVFNNMKLDELKAYLKEYFKIDYDISLVLKSNNKNVNLDKNGYDRKNDTFLTLKQMRLVDSSIIFITKTVVKPKDGVDTSVPIENELDEKINCIMRLEDDTEFVEVVKIRQNKTFNHLITKVKKQLGIDQNIRLRKELDNKIIYKSQYESKLYTEESFIDGGVRLMVEYGEPYDSTEFMIKIAFEIEKEKYLKDFIGDPQKILISDLKKFICHEFDLSIENHQFWKTNWVKDPVKAIKNESIVLAKLQLNDGDCLYLKDISSEIYETYLLKIYKKDIELSRYSIFTPLTDNDFLLELNVRIYITF